MAADLDVWESSIWGSLWCKKGENSELLLVLTDHLVLDHHDFLGLGLDPHVALLLPPCPEHMKASLDENLDHAPPLQLQTLEVLVVVWSTHTRCPRVLVLVPLCPL